MRLRSFDLFDTLLARDVARPTDLFLRCGRILRSRGLVTCSAEDFAKKRIEAERRAREDSSHAEPGFQEIHDLLADDFSWPPDIRSAAAGVELACESDSLRAVPAAARQLTAARDRGEQIVFISDMYLPHNFLREILEREALWQNGDRLYVSNEHRASKSSGALFEIVRRDFPNVAAWTHIGDNPHSDLRMPARLGIEAVPFTDCHLQPRERFIAGDRVSLWRSHLAGAMKRTRLNAPDAASEVWNAAVEVVAPILVGYVHWVLETAARQKLQRLYFVSRDGEILHKIAAILSAQWGYGIECRYFYGSRQAWHAAGTSEIGEFTKKWLFERDMPLSLEIIAQRLEVPLQKFSQLVRAGGQNIESPQTVLSAEQRDELWRAMQTPAMRQLIGSAATRQREQALGYFKQEGMLDPGEWAIVDVGWQGNMQHSLETILRAGGYEGEVLGLYFGLLPNAPQDARLSFWNEQTGRPFPAKRVTLVEIFTAGTEGPTLGYERTVRWIPRQNPPNLAGQKWGTPLLQAAVCAVTRAFAESVSREDIPPAEFSQLALELFQEFCQRPSPEEAAIFGTYPHSTDQRETHFRQMLDFHLPWSVFARKSWRRDYYHHHLWFEGQLAATPCFPARLAHRLRKLSTRLRRVPFD
jgi:predicted HAD superfamily hydrolase